MPHVRRALLPGLVLLGLALTRGRARRAHRRPIWSSPDGCTTCGSASRASGTSSPSRPRRPPSCSPSTRPPTGTSGPLRLRHRDLKQSWCVRVNGRDVACLPPDEADTISYLADSARHADGRPQRAANLQPRHRAGRRADRRGDRHRPAQGRGDGGSHGGRLGARAAGRTGGAEPHHGRRRARHAGVARQRDGRDARGEAGRGLQPPPAPRGCSCPRAGT